MGLKLLWIVFGATVSYAIAALLVPTVVVVLRNRGVDISDDAATNVTRLVALLATALGGALGLRHAQTVVAQRRGS
jgi:hypothetical protein